MRFSLIAATLAVATPILASPLVSRQEPNANCSAMAAYQFPSQTSDFSNVCKTCYDIAAESCASAGADEAHACTATRILSWSIIARQLADKQCTDKGTASAALACTSDKVNEWAKNGGCKPPL
ncbi:hypothetical protein BFW01_g305 [Lasiodiplodia theobromae]|uniref:Extracellular membrane protein CFEM domain-containing protein n=2 Tax=Lasiodiplodia TaxID=66739 RepID=A0A5N5D2E1_9PEZI|nr:Secreted protein [Lasiodiplodia theobromae]KAB2571829.1 hypothetical protein DBV05_g9481 [Lasiodiplodia theobromae]KAF4539629.1 Secreted protein [Lasiodiplodia theobromae]KAF9630124.1 hypothetical protein BFW01_g305 [Lasiodiplodia theobromae]KAK0638319.1 hypothetical protein DIS24_g9942 [Lasiodiplodia hormozganensis]